QGLAYWRLKFPEIQRWAVDRFAYCMLEAVARAGLSLDEIAWVIPHQASCTILREVAQRLELPWEKFVITYPRTGNISAASIPVALDQARQEGKFQNGDWLVMPAVGAGMAWGGGAFRWGDNGGDGTPLAVPDGKGRRGGGVAWSGPGRGGPGSTGSAARVTSGVPAATGSSRSSPAKRPAH